MNKLDFNIIDDFRASMDERLEAAARLAEVFTPDMDAVCEIDLHSSSQTVRTTTISLARGWN